MPIDPPMPKSVWNKSPYAGTTAKDSESQINRLLEKHGVKEVSIVNFVGPNGRAGFGVRFMLRGRAYRVAYEVLRTTTDVREEDKKLQVKRVVYHTLKMLLENSNVFASAEEVLFSYAEVPGTNQTAYEFAGPRLAELGTTGFVPLLGPKKGD